MSNFPHHDAKQEPIVLGNASTETLGDLGMDEPEGGPPVNGISED